MTCGATTQPALRPTTELGRIGSIDGLRGIAIGLTLLLHLFFLPFKDGIVRVSPRLWAVAERATCGVDLFFVISGFLIGGILVDWRESPRLLPVFFRRRFCRIVPLYYLLVGMAFLPLVAFPALDSGTRDTPALAFLLFLSNLWTARGWEVPLSLGVAWSLAIEEQFYVVGAVAVRFAPLKVVRVLLLSGVALSPLLRAAILCWGIPLSSYHFTLCRLDGICLGFLAAMWIRDEEARGALGRFSRSSPAFLAAGAAGLLALTQLSLDPGNRALLETVWPSCVALFFAALLIAAALEADGLLSRALRSGGLILLGRYSYFLYLFHLCFWGLAEELVPNGALAGVSAFAAVLAAAALSFRYLEAPLIEWSRRAAYGGGEG